MYLSESVRKFLFFCNEGMVARTYCPLCNSCDLKPLFVKWDFEHVLCRDCGLIFLRTEPPASVLDQMYAGMDYYKKWLEYVEKPALEQDKPVVYKPGGDAGWFNSIFQEVIERLDTRKGNWLDVGGGAGRFVRYVSRTTSFQTYLEEANPAYRRVAKDNGIMISRDSDMQFDVITLIAVLEHVPDTLQMLSRLSGKLVSGGIMYVITPRLGWLTRNYSRGLPLDIAPPMHLRFFQERTLEYISSKLTGIKLEEVWQSGDRVFHPGYILKPDAYTWENIVPEYEFDLRRKIKKYPVKESAIANGLNWVLSPLLDGIDGRRLLHSVWRKV